ncbi:hypothetical protein D3C80_1107300 [compost metagenome]
MIDLLRCFDLTTAMQVGKQRNQIPTVGAIIGKIIPATRVDGYAKRSRLTVSPDIVAGHPFATVGTSFWKPLLKQVGCRFESSKGDQTNQIYGIQISHELHPPPKRTRLPAG